VRSPFGKPIPFDRRARAMFFGERGRQQKHAARMTSVSTIRAKKETFRIDRSRTTLKTCASEVFAITKNLIIETFREPRRAMPLHHLAPRTTKRSTLALLSWASLKINVIREAHLAHRERGCRDGLEFSSHPRLPTVMSLRWAIEIDLRK